MKKESQFSTVLLRIIFGMTIASFIFFLVSLGTEISSGDLGSLGTRIGAICNDGWRSSSTGSGTCSSHGGVDYWLYRGGTESTYESHSLIDDTWQYHIVFNTFVLVLFIIWYKHSENDEFRQRKLLFNNFFEDFESNYEKIKELITNHDALKRYLNSSIEAKESLKITILTMKLSKKHKEYKDLIKQTLNDLFESDLTYMIVLYFFTVGALYSSQNFIVGILIIIISFFLTNFFYTKFSIFKYSLKTRNKIRYLKKII